MCRPAGVAIGVLLPMLLARCSGSPVAPSVPAPSLSDLSVSPAQSTLIVGQTRQYFAFGIFTSGSGGSVAAAWSTESSGVVQVDQTGLAVALAPGRATLVAAALGRSATLPLRVLPDCQGTWSGDLRVISCTSRELASCDLPLFRVGAYAPAPLVLYLLQTEDRLAGTLKVLPGATTFVEGRIDDAGRLAVGARTGAGSDAGARVVAVQAEVAPDGALRGTYTLDIPDAVSSTSQELTQRITWELVSFCRVGPASAATVPLS